MIKRLPAYILPYSMKIEDAELVGWIWDSHNWVEYTPGYFQCEWCKTIMTSTSPMLKDVKQLCKKNPIILELLQIGTD